MLTLAMGSDSAMAAASIGRLARRWGRYVPVGR
jgi:hypothetical protein